MKNGTKEKTTRLCVLAVFTAISIVLIAFVRIPLIPSAPFLTYDMADIPIIVATLMFGIVPGLIVLLISSIVQAFCFGGDGGIGLIMHFAASGAMVAVIGLFCSKKKTVGTLIEGMILGSIAMITVMVPMNLIFMPIFTGQDVEQIVKLIIPVILPFNATKAVLNCALAAILYKALSPFTNKMLNLER